MSQMNLNDLINSANVGSGFDINDIRQFAQSGKGLNKLFVSNTDNGRPEVSMNVTGKFVSLFKSKGECSRAGLAFLATIRKNFGDQYADIVSAREDFRGVLSGTKALSSRRAKAILTDLDTIHENGLRGKLKDYADEIRLDFIRLDRPSTPLERFHTAFLEKIGNVDAILNRYAAAVADMKRDPSAPVESTSLMDNLMTLKTQAACAEDPSAVDIDGLIGKAIAKTVREDAPLAEISMATVDFAALFEKKGIRLDAETESMLDFAALQQSMKADEPDYASPSEIRRYQDERIDDFVSRQAVRIREALDLKAKVQADQARKAAYENGVRPALDGYVEQLRRVPLPANVRMAEKLGDADAVIKRYADALARLSCAIEGPIRTEPLMINLRMALSGANEGIDADALIDGAIRKTILENVPRTELTAANSDFAARFADKGIEWNEEIASHLNFTQLRDEMKTQTEEMRRNGSSDSLILDHQEKAIQDFVDRKARLVKAVTSQEDNREFPAIIFSPQERNGLRNLVLSNPSITDPLQFNSIYMSMFRESKTITPDTLPKSLPDLKVRIAEVFRNSAARFHADCRQNGLTDPADSADLRAFFKTAMPLIFRRLYTGKHSQSFARPVGDIARAANIPVPRNQDDDIYAAAAADFIELSIEFSRSEQETPIREALSEAVRMFDASPLTLAPMIAARLRNADDMIARFAHMARINKFDPFEDMPVQRFVECLANRLQKYNPYIDEPNLFIEKTIFDSYKDAYSRSHSIFKGNVSDYESDDDIF